MSWDRNQIKVVTQYLKDIFENIKNLFNRSHSTNGVYFLTGTSASNTGSYYAFVAVTDTVVNKISYIDVTKQKGDISTMTFPAGMYVSIPGYFSTITLTSGSVILLIN